MGGKRKERFSESCRRGGRQYPGRYRGAESRTERQEIKLTGGKASEGERGAPESRAAATRPAGRHQSSPGNGGEKASLLPNDLTATETPEGL